MLFLLLYLILLAHNYESLVASVTNMHTTRVEYSSNLRFAEESSSGESIYLSNYTNSYAEVFTVSGATRAKSAV